MDAFKPQYMQIKLKGRVKAKIHIISSKFTAPIQKPIIKLIKPSKLKTRSEPLKVSLSSVLPSDSYLTRYTMKIPKISEQTPIEIAIFP